MPLARLISGGQTGVDRAALDAAIAAGLPHGGTCPAGRRAEDGPIPDRYALSESPSARYSARTERNVLDSEATLVVCAGAPTGGTALTIALARRHRRPCRIVDLDDPAGAHPGPVARWIEEQGIAALNVAGPRESGSPGIGARARAFVAAVLDQVPR